MDDGGIDLNFCFPFFASYLFFIMDNMFDKSENIEEHFREMGIF